MGKKARHKGTRTKSMEMNSRELRRHPEKAEQIRADGLRMFRAYMTNGIRKSC